MIRYQLICDKDHRFESWFQSAAAFDSLQDAGLLSCSHCGSAAISKSLMAPVVKSGDDRPLKSGAEHPLARLRAEIEAVADDVGTDFATEARAIHNGTKPDRAIYGQANSAEARALISEGVPVVPLPFIPSKKAH